MRKPSFTQLHPLFTRPCNLINIPRAIPNSKVTQIRGTKFANITRRMSLLMASIRFDVKQSQTLRTLNLESRIQYNPLLKNDPTSKKSSLPNKAIKGTLCPRPNQLRKLKVTQKNRKSNARSTLQIAFRCLKSRR